MKKGAIIIAIIIFLFIIKNLISSIFSTLDRAKMLSSLKLELSQKKQENEYLRQKLFIAKTDQFVEQEARTKLGLIKDGEQIVADRKIEPTKPMTEKIEPPNWQKWKDLFF